MTLTNALKALLVATLLGSTAAVALDSTTAAAAPGSLLTVRDDPPEEPCECGRADFNFIYFFGYTSPHCSGDVIPGCIPFNAGINTNFKSYKVTKGPLCRQGGSAPIAHFDVESKDSSGKIVTGTVDPAVGGACVTMQDGEDIVEISTSNFVHM